MSEDGMSWRTLSVRKILRVQEAEMSTLLLVEMEEKVEATLPKVQGVELSTLPKVEKVGPTCPKWRWRSEIARVQITGSVSSSSGGASQQPSLTPQPGVEFNKLPEETVVWSHVPMLPHGVEGLVGRHLVSEDEIGKNTGRAPRHSHLAVHQHLAPLSQGLVYEGGDLWEMQGNVLLRNVQQLQPLVLDVEWGVVSLVGVHSSISVALCSVEHMGHPQSFEVERVSCGPLVSNENAREDFI